MKAIPLLAIIVLSLCVPAGAQTFMDRVRRAFDSTKTTVGEAAHDVGRASRDWVARARENFRLSRPEYTRRARASIDSITGKLATLRNGPSGVVERRYFKTRISALEQHIHYANTEYRFLDASPSEEVFRQRQKDFDFTLWSLEQAMELAEAEAGY